MFNLVIICASVFLTSIIVTMSLYFGTPLFERKINEYEVNSLITSVNVIKEGVSAAKQVSDPIFFEIDGSASSRVLTDLSSAGYLNYNTSGWTIRIASADDPQYPESSIVFEKSISESACNYIINNSFSNYKCDTPSLKFSSRL